MRLVKEAESVREAVAVFDNAQTLQNAIDELLSSGFYRAELSLLERIFHYTSGEATGRSLDIIIPERLRARHWVGYRRVMATGESRYGHGDILAVPGIRKDGGRISLEFTIVPLRDELGQMVGMTAIMRDVTTRFEEMRALTHKLAEASRPPGCG